LEVSLYQLLYTDEAVDALALNDAKAFFWRFRCSYSYQRYYGDSEQAKNRQMGLDLEQTNSIYMYFYTL